MDRPVRTALLFCIAAAVLSVGPRCLWAEGPAPQPIEARAEPGVYHLGDLVPFTVRLPAASPAYFLEGDLAAGADWGPARIARVTASPVTADGRLSLAAEIQVFETGTIHLPPLLFTVRVGHDRRAYSLRLAEFPVTALLPPGSQPKPPILPPVSIPRGFPWMAMLAILLLAGALVAGVFLMKRRRRTRPAAPARPSLRETDPDRWVRGEIEALFQAKLAPALRYSALSQRLRDFLEIKTGQPFLEWTTGEVHLGLRRMPALTDGTRTELMGVLSLCDWACFARYQPGSDEEHDARARALNFVGALSLALRPAEMAS